jgi:phage shock protein E
MLDFLKGIFGKKVDLHELIRNGATIVDVRTKGEYQQGHIKNSVNIPLDKLDQNLKKLNKNKPVITCCASGMRSASAKSILKSNGFTEVHNGGAWTSLRKYLN